LKALKLFIKAGEENIEDMINLVARNRKETNLEQMLMDYLTG
jgi:hypothetical protein